MIIFPLFSEIWNFYMVNARVLKFHIQIPHEKKLTRICFFMPKFCPFSELCPFENKIQKSCVQDISKSIWAIAFICGILILAKGIPPDNFWERHLIFWQNYRILKFLMIFSTFR